jgi:site-specific recombinase XerD
MSRFHQKLLIATHTVHHLHTTLKYARNNINFSELHSAKKKIEELLDTSIINFINAMRKTKINKTVGIHGLRHSYATHLLECGTDMSFVQKLLGHKDIKTTEIYAKVSNRQLGKIKSPLDDL